MSGHIPDPIERFFDPLSYAMVPLVDGLARHALPRLGAFEQTRRINGVPIHYYLIPCRRMAPLPVLFIHGMGDNAVTWSLVAPLVARRHDVFMIDLPGYGLSGLPPGKKAATISDMTEIVSAFLDDVIARPTLLVGNSMGGWIAVRVAEKRPDMVRGIVLMNAGGALLDGHRSWDPFLELLSPADAHQARQVARLIFGALPPPLRALSARGMTNLFARPVVREFIKATDEPDLLSPDELHQLPTPTAILWGERDRFLPQGSFEFFRSHLPSPQVRVLKRCGHLPQRERPVATARFIMQFAQQIALNTPQTAPVSAMVR
ncbi:MAG: alpha/beta hydrolase [Roseiflexus sp.]|nr:alpha/beta hydrolase [Roseiflexus sp.]MCS7291055.1 alpha/beta hydrolase [Roseiflexus sp.]MDW8145817.1 alpha/beta hydrolase [Roseiflexaceae bacterium]MDW8232940.1 alpha/beta hydrolase [Roseiflexaceae bacterium]